MRQLFSYSDNIRQRFWKSIKLYHDLSKDKIRTFGAFIRWDCDIMKIITCCECSSNAYSLRKGEVWNWSFWSCILCHSQLIIVSKGEQMFYNFPQKRIWIVCCLKEKTSSFLCTKRILPKWNVPHSIWGGGCSFWEANRRDKLDVKKSFVLHL